MAKQNFDYEPIVISLLGPSRVGKTTLVTALLEQLQDIFAGTPFSIAPRPLSPTEKRLAQNRRELQSHIEKRIFQPGGIRGTSDLFTYELILKREEQLQLPINIVDFPGGWMDPNRRNEQWRELENHLKHSPILLVPVDATVLMEACLPIHRAAWPQLLMRDEIKDVVRYWAKQRTTHGIQRMRDLINNFFQQVRAEIPNLSVRRAEKIRKLEDDLRKLQEKYTNELNMPSPAVLVIAPLKCETYLRYRAPIKQPSRNRRQSDQQHKLRKEVLRFYNEVLEVARKECPNVDVWYCPVESIGCVAVERAEWTSLADGNCYLDCRFRVRRPFRRSPRGADVVMRALASTVRDVINYQRQVARATQKTLIALKSDLYPSLLEGIPVLSYLLSRMQPHGRRVLARIKENTQTAMEDELKLETLYTAMKAIYDPKIVTRLRLKTG